MMNKIYDFNEIQKIRLRQNRLILYYLLYALCFILALTLICFLVENNILLTVLFAFALLFFTLFSICFWKIKYGILKEYRTFLDNIETGKREEYVGVFLRKIKALQDGDWFDVYDFTSPDGKTSFLIHKQQSVCFDEGGKYHLTHIGKNLCEWKKIE